MTHQNSHTPPPTPLPPSSSHSYHLAPRPNLRILVTYLMLLITVRLLSKAQATDFKLWRLTRLIRWCSGYTYTKITLTSMYGTMASPGQLCLVWEQRATSDWRWCNAVSTGWWPLSLRVIFPFTGNAIQNKKLFLAHTGRAGGMDMHNTFILNWKESIISSFENT